MRTKTVALVAAGALALTTVGGVMVAGPALAAVTGVFLQADDPTDDATDTDKRGAVADRIAEELAPLVEDGTLTQEQAAKVGEHLAQSLPGGPEGPRMGGPPGLEGRGPGGAPGLEGPPDMKGGMGPGPMHQALETAAGSLGMTKEELRSELKDGATLGEIADAEGVGRADLVVDLVAAAKSELAERVESGDLTQEQADELTATLEERAAEALDWSWPGNRGHHGDN